MIIIRSSSLLDSKNPLGQLIIRDAGGSINQTQVWCYCDTIGRKNNFSKKVGERIYSYLAPSHLASSECSE